MPAPVWKTTDQLKFLLSWAEAAVRRVASARPSLPPVAARSSALPDPWIERCSAAARLRIRQRLRDASPSL